jgi:hypothetical protein
MSSRTVTRNAMLSLSALILLAAGVLALLPIRTARAHCQVPCGIYGDHLKFEKLNQHIDTIKKSMRLVEELSAEPGKNANQLIRWTINKDEHADLFAHEISWYFLQQRIKPDEARKDRKAYLHKLELCHNLLVTAMKCKQTTDQDNAEKLRSLLKQFREAYFTEEDLHHMGQEHSMAPGGHHDHADHTHEAHDVAEGTHDVADETQDTAEAAHDVAEPVVEEIRN